MKIAIRQAEQRDFPAIQAFLRESFGVLAPFKAAHRWRWQFVENPYRLCPPDRVPVWIAVSEEKVVGQIAVQPGAIMIDRCVYTVGWIVDVMILPAYRGRCLGHRLHDAVARNVPILLMLTMAPATRRMAVRSGAVELGEAWQFVRWIRLRPLDVRRYLIRRLERRPRLRSIARYGCDFLGIHWVFARMANAMTAVWAVSSRRIEIDRDIAEIRSFGPEIDQMWRSIAPHFDALTVRDSRYLNWRFGECPDLKYRRFVARVNDLVVGYCVLRWGEPVELRLGIIADLFAAPHDQVTLTSLIDYAILYFGDDLAAIDCVTSSAQIARLLWAKGFFRTRTTVATGRFADDSLRAQVRRPGCEWYFTKSDHDWDQIQVA